jgi:hypothetical protein
LVAASAPPNYIPTEPLATIRQQRQPNRGNGATTGHRFEQSP